MSHKPTIIELLLVPRKTFLFQLRQPPTSRLGNPGCDERECDVGGCDDEGCDEGECVEEGCDEKDVIRDGVTSILGHLS